MTQSRHTLFISDLHLSAEYPETTAKFLHLLDTCGSSTDAIYILGDLFEAWIGDDDHSEFNQIIIHALKQTTQRGIQIYFLHGNRDFLIGKQFSSATGCQLLPEEAIVSLYDARVLLMHGDTLCTEDHQYQKARKWLRHPLVQQLFLWLPLNLRRKIADKMRMQSMQHTSATDEYLMDVNDTAVDTILNKYKVSFLIHGHTHKPGQHTITTDQHMATRLVLGAWHDHAYVLIWNAHGKTEVFID